MHRHMMTAVIAAAAAGWLLAVAFEDSGALLAASQLLKTLFLGALKLIIAPLVFFSLISGVLRLGTAARMAALGGWTILYYLLTTLIAIAVGLAIVTWFHPWTNVPAPTLHAALPPGTTLLTPGPETGPAGIAIGLIGQILVNPFTALAETNLLAIVANALAIGIAALLVLPPDSPLPDLVHDATAVTYKLAGWAVLLVPVGVLGIVYQLALSTDIVIFHQLLTFAGVVFGATAVHGLIVLPLIAWTLTGWRPLRLMKAIAEPFSVALTTSSSSATLPVSLRAADEALGVDPSVSRFVLPLGATMNMDGTALFEGIAAVFLAYLFNVDLSGADIVIVFFVTMIASVGAPGIPSGSMAGMQVVLLSVGIPLEAIGLLLLIERPLDTFRTAVNVEGDLVGALVVHHRAGRIARDGLT